VEKLVLALITGLLSELREAIIKSYLRQESLDQLILTIPSIQNKKESLGFGD
jgi:hypothetical protein